MSARLQTVLSPAVPQTPITIQEDQALETEAIRPTSQDGLPADTTRRRSANRLSENRASIGTIIGPDSKLSTGTSANASNRSSATIKGMQVGGSGLSDADFDLALRKFASERESFLEEISFTTGMVQQSRPASPDHVHGRSEWRQPTMKRVLEISGREWEAFGGAFRLCKAV